MNIETAWIPLFRDSLTRRQTLTCVLGILKWTMPQNRSLTRGLRYHGVR